MDGGAGDTSAPRSPELSWPYNRDTAMALPIQFPPAPLAEICQRYGVRRLSVFGSALRSDFGPESDVDVLVEFEPGHSVGFFRLAAFQRELSALIGREVDVRTPADLSPYFRDDVVKTAREQYAA